jgi:hypothetical protein
MNPTPTTFDWEAHHRELVASVAGREDEVVHLAVVLHEVDAGPEGVGHELNCYCGEEDKNDPYGWVFRPAPNTGCWKIAAAILVKWKPCDG